jgi:hypothetical protein
MAAPKKATAKKKMKVLRDLAKPKKTLTAEQAKAVKGGTAPSNSKFNFYVG